MGNGLRRRSLGLRSPQAFGALAMGQEDVQVAGKPVDFPRCELVAAIVEEMGKAPHTHGFLEVNKQAIEGFDVGCVSVEHEGVTPVPLRPELVN